MFKCAFLGCGPRARAHARVYGNVPRGRIVAVCDLDEKRLQSFGDEFKVAARYRDAADMLTREKPDVLHVVTCPNLRVPLLSLADQFRVPAVIVEKPIALQGEDWCQLRDLAGRTRTRVVVNTQLHFHARNLELKRDVAEGRIGEVRFIDCSAGSTPLDQGVHVLELAHSYNGFADFTMVFGQVSGAAALTSRQPAPDMAAAIVAFQNGVRAQMVCGSCAPRASANPVIYQHKRIAVYGTRGFVQWTMAGWERLTADGRHESGAHEYTPEDDLAQARLTEAVFDWLLDANRPHPTRLERSLSEFNVVLGLYVSALRAAPVTLPVEPPNGLLDALKAKLGQP